MNILKTLLSNRQEVRSWQIAWAGVLLACALLYFLQFTYAYFGHVKQLFLGWGCFLAIFLLYKSKKSRQQPWRSIFIVLSAFLAIRYIQWRALDTLLYTGPFDFIGMSLLFLAEVYGLAIYFLGMFVNVWPLESRIIPLPAGAERLPTVDVFIPTYNESDDIVRITATAATQLDYPREKLRIYLLDDGATHAKRNHPETGMAAWERHYRLREMAAELGIGYITRETNQQAKAGNINHALRYSDGELILFLDCDHVPTKDFLQNTVGQFIADPKLFLVQTPHFFINPTPVEKNLAGIANPSGENDMFYRKIHLGLNFWNSSYFCGSAAVLRRKCLEEVGGISGITITEDAETAFLLHSRGYNSVYINKPMVCGLSPETYDAYVTQRSRWAQGMVQLILLNNPLRTKGLSTPQKVSYFNSSFFWFFGLPRFIYFIAPATYLIFGLNIYHASWLQILAFALPYVLSIYVAMDFFYAGSRQPLFSEIYESVQSLFLIPAVLSVVLDPWNPSFQVTKKGETNDKDYLSPLAAPFFLVIMINVIALTLAVIQWFAEPLLRDVFLVTGVWCLFNLYLGLVSLGAFWEHKQVRHFYRINARGQVTVHFLRMGSSHVGEVRDVSMTGIGFEIELPFLPREHEQVILEVKDSYGREYRFENQLHRALPQNGKYLCGSEFMTDRVSYADAVSYVFGDSLRWREVWNMQSNTKGTARMLRYFFVSGFKSFIAGIIPILRELAKRLWVFAVKWLTTPVLRDRVLAVTSWMVYYFYLALASLVETLDRKQVRKLGRFDASGAASMYFPHRNATLLGQVADISMTGMGVVTVLPFEVGERERVTIKTHDRNGRECQFECFIQRTIKRDEKILCGAAFIVDVFSYPRIVQFVYGDSAGMLRYLLMSGGSQVIHVKEVMMKIVVRSARATMRILTYLFLNPATRSKTTQEKLP